MNEYFQLFQNITESVEETLKAESNSLEIQQSAIQLKKSVQPCLEELKLSASRLKQLVQVSLNELDRAENVWNSKPRIAQVPKLEIWEHIGEISGRTFKLPLLGRQCKYEALKQAKESWKKRYELLKKTWFVDAKTWRNKDVAVWDKDKLLQDIRLNLDLQAKDMNLILSENLRCFYQELTTTNLEKIKYYDSLLAQQSKADYKAQIDQIVSEIESKFSNLTKNLPGNVKGFSYYVNPALETLAKQGFLPITLEQFSKFSEEQVITKIENIINSVFDDRVKLATQALEQAVAFYNDFLERQARYQQETPEQRQAQKAWINKQRQELVRVQYGIEAILNPNVE